MVSFNRDDGAKGTIHQPNTGITQYGSTVYIRDGPGWLVLCMYLRIIAFSLWCTELLASLMCRYGQMVRKWV